MDASADAAPLWFSPCSVMTQREAACGSCAAQLPIRASVKSPASGFPCRLSTQRATSSGDCALHEVVNSVRAEVLVSSSGKESIHEIAARTSCLAQATATVLMAPSDNLADRPETQAAVAAGSLAAHSPAMEPKTAASNGPV